MNSDLPYADNVSIFFGNQKVFPMQISRIELCLTNQGNNSLLILFIRGTDFDRHICLSVHYRADWR
jgi:hypothetical protein